MNHLTFDHLRRLSGFQFLLIIVDRFRHSRQKNARGEEKREQLAWAARRASTWLLEKVRGKDPKDARERRWVKGQTHEETMMNTGKWNIRVPGYVGPLSSIALEDEKLSVVSDCAL